jgi:Acyl-CoA thioesterase C-terminal domain/Acyl-CoA thioesterase N-terminal domain
VSLFEPAADGRVRPTVHTRGPWDPSALHGGAAAALIVRAFERFGSEASAASEEASAANTPAVAAAARGMIARLGLEFVKPIPFAELSVTIEVVRDGRRVQELAAVLTATADGGPGEEPIGRANALRIQPVPHGLPDPEERRELPGPKPVAAMPGPQQGEPIVFALHDVAESFATTGMQMRWLSDPRTLGPARVWMALDQPIVGEEPASPLQRLVATADFGNGVSRELDFERYLFINADLTVHLWREPRGEWIGLDAKTVLMDGGAGMAESVLHDLDGPVGRAFQTLVVEPR